MSTKTTLVLIGILVLGLVGLVIFAPPDEPPAGSQSVFPNYLPSDVTSASWALSTQETEVRRSGDGFEVKVGEAWVPADRAKVEEVLTELGDLRVRERIAASKVDAASLQEWGLDPVRAWVAFEANGEKHRIDLGGDTLKRDTIYASLQGEDDVLFVADALFDVIENLRTPAVRQRKLFDWTVTDVDRVEVRQGEQVRFEAKRAPDDKTVWRGVVPFTGYVSPDVMESNYLPTILRIEVSDFVADDVKEADLAKYGLADPRWTVTLHRSRGGEATRKILIGDPVPDKEDHAYFMIDGRPFVYDGDLYLVIEQLSRPIDEMKDRNISRLGWTAVGKMDVNYEGSSFTIVRDEAEGWRLEEPEKRSLERESVEKWRDMLRRLEATEVRDHPDLAALGLAEPKGRIVLYPQAPETGHDHDAESEKKPEEKPAEPVLELLYGNVTEDGRGVWMMRKSDPGTAYLGGLDALTLVRNGYWPLLPKAVFTAGPGDESKVVALTREQGEEKTTLEREGEVWPPADANSAAVNSVVSKLLDIHAVRWLGPAEGHEAEYGLDQPALRLVVSFRPREKDVESGEPARREFGVIVGAETPGGRFARPILDGTPGEAVFVLPAATWEFLTVPLVEDPGSTKESPGSGEGGVESGDAKEPK